MFYVVSAIALMIALLHLWILVLEMLLWEQSRTREIFGTTPEFAKATRAMAANQGLYNGFLAVGLLIGVILGDRGFISFFLTCVAVAGIFGAATVSMRIFFVQALPALIALLLLVLA